MLIIPHDSTLHLCRGVELDPNYEYTIDFETRDKQREYFTSKQLTWFHENEGYSHIRVNESIRVDVNISDILNCNYVYFTNDNIGVPKTFYAFITSKEYINDDTTQLNLKLDVMQTFMFDYELGECFVEREHQDRWRKKGNELKPIFNTQKEDINYGEEYLVSYYKHSAVKDYRSTSDPILFAYIFATEPLYGEKESTRAVDGVIRSGYYIYCLPFVNNDNVGGEENWTDLWWYSYNDVLGYHDEKLSKLKDILTDEYISNAKISQIIISPIPPIPLVASDYPQDPNAYRISPYPDHADTRVTMIFEPVVSGTNVLKINYRDSQPEYNSPIVNNAVTPIRHTWLNYDHTKLKDIKNETKIYTYPYNFSKIRMSDASLLVKNEYITDDTEVLGYQSIDSKATSAIYLTKYLEHGDNLHGASNNNIATAQQPLFIDLITDAWKQYMLQNKNQRMAGFISEGVNLGVGLVTGGLSNVLMGEMAGLGVLSGISQITSSATKIASQLAKEKDIKNQPDDVKQFNGDISMAVLSNNELSITSNEYKLTPEYEKKVYDYFYHYGYKCNDFKVPNTKSRYYFNFIKCSDVVIITDIATDYINEIKEIYKKGITFWHYRADYKGVNTYDYENAEMSIEEANA